MSHPKTEGCVCRACMGKAPMLENTENEPPMGDPGWVQVGNHWEYYPRYIISERRKPWNKLAQWLFAEAHHQCDCAHIINLQNQQNDVSKLDLHWIKEKLIARVMEYTNLYGTKQTLRAAQNIEFSMWYGSDRWRLGIKQKSDIHGGSALVIYSEDPEPEKKPETA